MKKKVMKKKKLLVEVKEGFFARAQKEEIHTGHYVVALLVVCWIVSSLIVTFGSIYLDLRQ